MAAPTFLVVSIATDEMREMRELSFPNKKAWCERHGYIWAGASKSLDPSRPPAWSKVALLMRLSEISPGSWAFWTDADSIITRPDWKLESIADDNADLLIAQDRNGINSGVFMIRLGTMAWNFLREVYGHTEYLHHRWWEQAAIRHVLDSGYPFRVKFADKILVNAYPDDFVEGHSAILHVPNNMKMWPDRIGELKKRLLVAVP
jgi:hypothetical protein